MSTMRSLIPTICPPSQPRQLLRAMYIYVPTDNTAASNTEIINNICQPAGIPVITGEEGICSGCGVATLSISYYDLGVATGKMAVKILNGESDISEMPIEYAPQFTKKYNPDDLRSIGNRRFRIRLCSNRVNKSLNTKAE